MPNTVGVRQNRSNDFNDTLRELHSQETEPHLPQQN